MSGSDRRRLALLALGVALLVAGSSSARIQGPPAIESFSPRSGPVGTDVTIVGSGFGTQGEAVTAVAFNGVDARLVGRGFDARDRAAVLARVPQGATTGRITVTTAAGTATSGIDFTVVPPRPRIVRLAPRHGSAGDKVTILGKHFEQVVAVRIGGVDAEFSVLSSGRITAIVPREAPAGERETVLVATAGGVASLRAFEVEPRITGVAPRRAHAGERVTILGTGLTGIRFVWFGARTRTSAFFRAVSPTKIVAMVPPFARTGRIEVAVFSRELVASSGDDVFTVLPTIDELVPRSAEAGRRSPIDIRGSGLEDVVRVTFNGVKARFSEVVPTLLLAFVPQNATSGRVRVFTRHGTATSRESFTVLP